jgi:hypothetical protein
MEINNEQEQEQRLLQGLLPTDNQPYSNTPPQNLQSSDYLEHTKSNASDFEHLDKRNKTYISSANVNKDSSEFKNYLCEYQYGDSHWGLEIKATSRSDALARLKAISYGEVKGELYVKIPIKLGVVAKFLTWFKNFIE